MEDFTKLDGVHDVWTYDSITYEKNLSFIRDTGKFSMVQSKRWNNIQPLTRMRQPSVN